VSPQQKFLSGGRRVFPLSSGTDGASPTAATLRSSISVTQHWSCRAVWRRRRPRYDERWRAARTPRVWPPSTIRTLPSRPLLLDDRALVALLVGERLPITRGAERFTTTYFWFRACRAVVVGAGGRLSGPFERLEPGHRAAALEHMLALPGDVGLPEPRLIVPVMVGVQRRHPGLNVLNTEAAAAALLLGAKMVISPPTAQGQLEAVLPVERIAFQTVDLP